MYALLQPANCSYEAMFGGPTLESLLLSRHDAIDRALAAEIEAGRVGQVLEVAAGMSPRGLRFVQRYPQLRYVEADLDGMSRRKARALRRTDTNLLRHRVARIDALAETGPYTVDAVARRTLDPSVGTAIVTEGLVNYLDRALLEGTWSRFARVLERTGGTYLSDIHLRDETYAFWTARVFEKALRVFARGAIHLHYATAADALEGLHRAGFADARVDPPRVHGANPASPNTAQDMVSIVFARK